MLRVVIVDMQPITPAVGGGRQRLLGLYHDMGPGLTATYVGSFDWPGEAYRDEQITPTLREVCVPLSDAHFVAASRLSESLGGATVIDSAFTTQVALSPDFIGVASRHIAEADVVVFSHPWAYTPLRDAIEPRHLVVYDSHNVESILKTELLDARVRADSLLQSVVSNEYALCRRADLVMTCSHEDSRAFSKLFDLPPDLFRVVPNGAFTGRFGERPALPRATRQQAAGVAWDGPVAIFMGSSYGPNNAAAQYIVDVLVPQRPEVQFIIVGGASESVNATPARNLLLVGTVDEERRDALLLASDIALNPVGVGSGTNIKMFDYMAAGLPVLTTEVGSRGICDSQSAPMGIYIERLDGFAARLKVLSSAGIDESARASVRKFVASRFSWEAISRSTGQLISQRRARWQYPGKSEARRSRIGVFSTWNVNCGIAEHSGYFSDALVEAGADVVVLGNSLAGHPQLGYQADMSHSVVHVWNWDNRTWSTSGFEADVFETAVATARFDALVVQHHTGFMPAEAYLRLVRMATSLGVSPLVEMHDSRGVSIEDLAELVQAGAQLLLHGSAELDRLPAALRVHAQVWPLPVRVARLAGAKSYIIQEGRPPVISGFGFLRRYKGLLTTVRVIAALSAQFPGITYRGHHAVYPSDDSAGYLDECLREADRLGVRGQIHISTDFAPMDKVMRDMRDADVIVLPYLPSEEGASAAANAALASGTPVVASQSRIFDSVRDLLVTPAGEDADDYAQAIASLLNDEPRRRKLGDAALAWLGENSYEAAASRFIARHTPLVKGIPNGF